MTLDAVDDEAVETPGVTPAPAVDTAAGPSSPRRGEPGRRDRRRVWRWAAISVAIGMALLLAAAGALRLGARTDAGRAIALRLVNGLPLGSAGRLRIEGLQGDPLGELRVARLAIVDPKGAWLLATNVSMRWRPAELLARRFHAERLDAQTLRIVRRPVATPQPAGRAGGLTLAIAVDALHARLETLPAFSVRRGVWDVSAGLRLARNGAAAGRVEAQSRLHAGDGLTARFRLGEGKQVLLQADAVEAQGGALAGALGLPADQRLSVRGRADGAADAGALTLVAVSGDKTPLNVQASWSRGGAALNAQFLFTTSRLTNPLADRAGPDGRLTVSARHGRGDLYDLKGAFVMRDASLTAQGPIDWRGRRTPGLTLRLQLADLGRWIADPQSRPGAGLRAGTASTTGVLTGDIDRFDYKGALDSQTLATSAYALARVSGPVTITRSSGELRVQADLAGLGGAGKGLTPALLGPAPHVRFDVARLADRRVLVRQLGVQGAGLKVQAQGGQDLFGGLSFKGSADVSNLAAAHPGARGVIDAAWSASQAKGAAAWRVNLDAKASGFASGASQVDHLLGSAPTLKADAAYGPDGLSLARADLAGAGLQAGARGRVDSRNLMNFDVDWTARGPFDAGPVEVAGQVKGTGRLTGAVAEPHLDLGAELASVSVGRLLVAPAHLTLAVAKDASGVGGQVALNGSSRFGPAVARATFRLDGSAVDLSGIDADAGGVRASGAVSLRDGAPSTADLSVDARPGAFLSSGHLGGRLALVQKPGGLAATVSLDGQDVAAPGAAGVVHTLHLSASGPWSRLPFQLVADSRAPQPWRFAGSGVLNQAGPVRELDLSGQGRIAAADVKTTQPAVLRIDGATRDLKLQLAVGGGHADVAARQQGDVVEARATLSRVALTTFDRNLVGAANATLTLAGRGATLNGVLDATLSGARSRDAPANLALHGRLHAQLAGPRLHLVAGATNAQGLQSALDVTLPASAAAQPFHLALDRTQPMQGSFSADGELRPLWDLLVGGEQTLSGHVVAKGAIAGTLADPRATGTAALTDGRFQDAGSGLSLQALALNADFGHDEVQVRRASGADGHGGTLSGTGAVSLQRGGGSTFALKLAKFRLFDNDLGRASVSGDLAVARDTKGQAKLSGALRVDRADITANTPTPTGVVAMDVVEINRTPKPGDSAPPVRTVAGPPLALDVAIRAPRGVFIRGKGLSVELSLDAHVGGTAADPDLTGAANVVLGAYDFAGKRFDFDQRGVIHLASDPADIRLDLSATLQEPTLTAVVRVLGTAAKPDITLSSTPVLPQDEVLSQVLFGASASQLAPAQAAELASALASLSRGGGFDLLGRLRQFAGLDRLALGAGASGTGVAGGKYINDNIYVELIGGGREGPQAAVEWRVRKNFSIVSQVGTQGDAQLSIQFRKNY